MYIKCLYYIQYNCGCCALKKGVQCQRFSQLWPTQQLETPQRVSSDSLGVGAIEIRRKNAPDRRQCRQEVPKRSLAMLTLFLMFLIKFLMWRGRPDPLYPFHTTPWRQVHSRGGLSGCGGCAVCTFARSGTCCASWLMGLVAQCRGIIYNIFADIEDAEKHSHVPAKILYMIPLRCATNSINQEAQQVPLLVKVHTAQPPQPDKPPRECTWRHGVVWNG